MSSKKPGLFRRLKNAISSTMNDAVDSVRDPGREVALMLDDLAAQIQQAEKDLRQALVDRKVMERKLEEARKEEDAWQGRAEQALKLGDESLARAALQKKSEIGGRRADLDAGVREQGHLVEQMQIQIRDSKQRLKTLNLRRGSLMAQARAVKRGVGPSGVGAGGPTARLDDIEARISEVEALNEVASEEFDVAAEAARIDAKLGALEAESDLDDELARLKAKMRAKGALTEGSSQGE